jgi:hypothetical protein
MLDCMRVDFDLHRPINRQDTLSESAVLDTFRAIEIPSTAQKMNRF